MDEPEFTFFSFRRGVTRCVIFLALSLAITAHAEDQPPPSLDMIGGYFDGDTYRCYADPCFKIHKITYPTANGIRFNPDDWPYWLDLDDNCQSEREQLLERMSTTDVEFRNNDSCSDVIAGEWIDPYTGDTIDRVENVAIDHRISLREAHEYGGSAWTRGRRAVFANLPANLVIVSAKTKQARAGRPAYEWMPEDQSSWCDYVVHREVLARKFSLRLPEAEREFDKRIKQLYCKY